MILFLFFNSSWAQIYQWTDEQDVVHFSDKTSKNAKIWSNDDSSFAKNTFHYDKLQITRPSHHETIRNN